ncbi:MAG: transcriptional repressor LexA [Polyangiales bacterium]
MQKLTDRQQAVLDFITNSIDAHGFPPTLREIGNHLGIRSTNGVNDHLRALERKGYLTREDMKSRTLRPTSMKKPVSMGSIASFPDNLVSIPIVGRVAAGSLTEAIEQPSDTFTVDRNLVGGRSHDVFGLRVNGDSMIEAGIHSGDFVFVRKQDTASRGDIIIALVGDEATCKYYYPEREHIRLEPANATMAPILIPKNDWRTTQVLGIVVGVYRKLAA